MALGGGADPAGDRLDVMAQGWCLGATQESCYDEQRWCGETGEEEVAQFLPGGEEAVGRWRSHARGMLVRAMGNQLAITRSSPPALRTASSYASRKIIGPVTPS